MPYTDTTTFNLGGRAVTSPRARLTATDGAVLAPSVAAGWQTFPGNVLTFTYTFPDGWRGTVEVLDGSSPIGLGASVQPPAAAGSGGTGAYAVTITVTDGTQPLQQATVRVTEGVNSLVATTNAAGVAAFGLDAATWAVTITKPGYAFAPTTIVVSGDGNFTFAMSPNVLPQPASPSGCVVVAVTRTQQLAVQGGVTVGFRYVSIPAASGTILPRDPLLVVSTPAGNVSAELLRGAVVKYWRGKEPARSDATNTFMVPDAASYMLPDLLGEDGS